MLPNDHGRQADQKDSVRGTLGPFKFHGWGQSTLAAALALCLFAVAAAQEPAMAAHAKRVVEARNYDRPAMFLPFRWFPLVEGARYTYRGTFKDKSETWESVIRCLDCSDGSVFVAANPAKLDEPVEFYGVNMLMFGTLFTDARGLWAGPLVWKYDFADVRKEGLRLVVERPPQPGFATTIVDGAHTKTITVMPREDVVVPAGRFSACVKLEIHDDWGRTESTAYAWFADDVGLVKWIRNTGRVEELVEYSIPRGGW